MTCDDCQAIVIDIARGNDVDRLLRDDARRHAALCPRCGEQQQEQQWLTTQFRAIATADADRHAPERVQVAALAAWRASYGNAGAPPTPSAGAPVVSIATAGAGPRVRRWMLPSVAMAGLAAAAMATIVLWPSHGGLTNDRVKTGTVAASHAPENITSEPRSAGTSRAVPRNTESRGASVTPDSAVANAAAMPEPETLLASASEADEFVSLPYVEPLRSTEARHVIRVSMTSGDEMILGVLPADRRNGQPFEADVLVGEDGIARAIRVVR